MATRLDREYVGQVLLNGVTPIDFIAMAREVDRLEGQVATLEQRVRDLTPNEETESADKYCEHNQGSCTSVDQCIQAEQCCEAAYSKKNIKPKKYLG